MPKGIREKIPQRKMLSIKTGNWKFTFEVIVAIFGNGIDINVDRIENLFSRFKKG